MNHDLHWSQTSSRLLNACPRAWVNTYATRLNSRSTGGATVSFSRQRRPNLEDAVVSALRSTWTDLLNDRFVGTTWTKPYREQRLKRRLSEALDERRLNIASGNLHLHLKRGVDQLDGLERAIGLRPMMRSSGGRWAYFERLDGVNINGVTMFTAPDVAFYHQQKWTLVRLQFRSAAEQTFAQQIEHLLMVRWAMAQPGFPNDPEAYSVKVIRWHRRQWIEHRLRVDNELLMQADGLVRHDLQEMKYLLRCWNSDAKLASVPYANSPTTCESCAYRGTCPAGEGLMMAKEEQERYIVEMHQSKETKSARTA